MRQLTEAMGANRRLEAERRHLLSLFEQAPGFVCFMRGREFIFEMANVACFQLVGRRDMLGRPAREALPELEGQGYLELLEQVFARGEPFVGRGMRIRLQREPGAPLSEAFIDFVLQPIRDAGGRVTGILAQGQDVTEARRQEERRVAAEERLRASERRYRMATRATQDAIRDWDLSTDTLEWNEGVEDLFGHCLEDLPRVISWWYQHVHPEDRDRVVKGIHAAIDSGAWNWRDEYRFLRRDGSYALVTDHGFIDHDASGRPVRMVGAMQAVTARHQAEEAMRRSEEQFRTLADSIPQLVWMAEADGAVRWYNRRWYEYTGTSPEQMQAEDGWGWKKVHDPAELPRVVARFQSALRSGEPWEDTFALRRHDGALRWHLSRAMPLRDADGRVVRWFGTHTDIHDQREAERERAELLHRESQARAEAERALALLDAFFDAAPLGFAVLDRELRHVRVNARVVADTNRASADQLLGRRMREVVSPSAADQVEPALRTALETGRPVVNMEVTGGSAVRPEEVRHFLLSFYPVRTRAGEVLGVCNISMEITERKRAERARELFVEAGRVLSDSLDLGKTLRNIARLAVSHFAEYCVLDVLDERGELRRLEAATSVTEPRVVALVQKLKQFPPQVGSQSPLAKVLASGQPTLLDIDPEHLEVFSRNAEHQAVLEALQPRSAAIIPLVARGRTLGIINLAVSHRTLDATDLEVARGIADRAAVALDNARLFEQLRVSEARLQAIIDNSSAVIFLKDAQGRYTLVNRRFEEVTGHRLEDVLGRTDLELSEPASVREVRANDLHVLSTGAPVEREETVPLPGGELRTYLSLKFPLLGPEGRPRAVGGISTDITERKAAEVQLRRYADRLEALHGIDLAILQGLPRAALARAALSALRRLKGCEAARLLLHEPGSQSARLFELVGPEKRWAERDVPLSEVGGVEELTRGGTALIDVGADAGATPLDRALAREGLGFLLKSPLRLGEALVGSLRLHGRRPDVFGPVEVEMAHEVADQVAIALEQARLRERLKGEAQRLEQQVRQRTAQLQEANAELEAFSYSVSHDLRAPLRSIEGFTQAVEDDTGNVLTERSRRFFGKVRSAAARMAELIDDLLQFSRLSRVEPRRGPVDVTALAREVVSELRARAPERRVEVRIQEGMRALADVRLLRVVLENLLGNAWKFTGQRETARIEVGVAREGEERVFRVSDDGAGFDMAYARKLFGPFQRMHRDEEFPGTGIGLATVQRIVHRHGGRIWAESQVGRGATFFFTLGGP